MRWPSLPPRPAAPAPVSLTSRLVRPVSIALLLLEIGNRLGDLAAQASVALEPWFWGMMAAAVGVGSDEPVEGIGGNFGRYDPAGANRVSIRGRWWSRIIYATGQASRIAIPDLNFTMNGLDPVLLAPLGYTLLNPIPQGYQRLSMYSFSLVVSGQAITGAFAGNVFVEPVAGLGVPMPDGEPGTFPDPRSWDVGRMLDLASLPALVVGQADPGTVPAPPALPPAAALDPLSPVVADGALVVNPGGPGAAGGPAAAPAVAATPVVRPSPVVAVPQLPPAVVGRPVLPGGQVAPLPLPPVPQTPTGSEIINGIPIIPNPPAPNLPAMAEELGRIEQKLRALMEPSSQGSIFDELLNSLLQRLLNALLDALTVDVPASSYQFTSVCETDEDGQALVREIDLPGADFPEATIARLDALAEAIQQMKVWRQPVCKGGRASNVTVYFSEVGSGG